MGGADGALGREPHPPRRREFLAIAPQVPVRTTTTPFPLAEANEALRRLREGEIEGAAVLVP
jgi:propanol-preferring alcohol dehydrogenase